VVAEVMKEHLKKAVMEVLAVEEVLLEVPLDQEDRQHQDKAIKVELL
tara:strand:+ start:264 stop:404 length:141 start_codon:yes stop_codon:yes gene_type:complete